jgi:hypothetical protein
VSFLNCSHRLWWLPRRPRSASRSRSRSRSLTHNRNHRWFQFQWHRNSRRSSSQQRGLCELKFDIFEKKKKLPCEIVYVDFTG